MHINSEQWWWKIIADLIGIGGMVLIAAFLYRAMHYAMGYKPLKYLVRFTSLTALPFWRRYKFSNKSRSQAGSREMNKKTEI